MFTIIGYAIALLFAVFTVKNVKENDNLNAVLCALIAAAALYFSL